MIRTERAVSIFKQAFETYWSAPSTFKKSASAEWMGLGLAEVDARITFSPHSASNSVLKSVAEDIRSATSSIFYSLAFLANTPGVIRDALGDQTGSLSSPVSLTTKPAWLSHPAVPIRPRAMSPRSMLTLRAPSGKRRRDCQKAGWARGCITSSSSWTSDFDQPGALVYLGSYNMSKTADGDNGENLIAVRDKRVATSYMIEAIRIIDHYQFRVSSKKDGKALKLKKPPRSPGETPWWDRDYTDPGKIRDRELFCP
ncbi:hypothetical protein [Rhizobium leguminosarum]|uniref:hypothetical protein n=1 Tax=Rhizobium leguminosarum TaxID=384 RepID=UPI0028ABD91E|nr:hypothetical protein [Rhizobium leguminosarum]